MVDFKSKKKENLHKKRSSVGILILGLFLMVTSGLFAQTVTLKGKVTEADTNMPFPGATVVVLGTTNGTITDVDGNYSLSNVPSDATIVFSFIGMKTQQIAVAGQTTISVALEAETIGLEEVVAVGYGTVKKRDITGSVASVSGDDIAAVPVADAAQAMQGKLSGVSVVAQDGRPDAEVSIRIRGGGSITQSNDPLFIVDGFPVSSISDIPGDQIESIDVLKDASSTAIYGARGANGVIIVTTKSGKDGKLSVTYDGYMKYNTPVKYLGTLNSYDYLAYNWAYADAISDSYADAWEMAWGIGRYESAYNNSAGIDHYKSVKNKNFAKEAYNSSFSHNHNITLSNGNDKTKYILSVNHTDNDGMKVNSWLKRTSASFKVDQKLADNLSVNVDTRYTTTSKVSGEPVTNGKGSILSSAYQFRPIATEDVLGELDVTKNTQLGDYEEILSDKYNPVARLKDYSPFSKSRKLRANTSLNWEIIEGLTYRTELGLSAYWNRSETWSGAIYNDYYDDDGNKTYAGDASVSASEGWSTRWANTLTYEFQNTGDHDMTVLVGQEVSDSGSESISISGERYPASFTKDRAFAMMDQYDKSEGSTYYSLGSDIGYANRILSGFGRMNYSFKQRYLFTATFRADGSSRFAPSNQWGYFPAAALGWRVSEEAFMQNLSWLDNLKVRLSYGSVGNDGISPSLWNFTWASGGLTRFSVGDQQQTSYEPESSTSPNPNLKWETTITRNLGVDYNIFNNKFFGTVDVYYNSTKDLLMRTKVPVYVGASESYENIGETSNKGVEFTLTANVIRSKDFNLTASMNINFNKNNVEKLKDHNDIMYSTLWGSSMTQPNTGDYILKEGSSVGQVRGYVYDGWYTTDDFDYSGGVYTLEEGKADIGSGIIGTVYGTNDMKPGGQVAAPGVVKYKDISGPDGTPDGVVDENDVTIIGDMNPVHTGGFNVSGNYKALDFSLNFNWSYGNDVYNVSKLAAFYGSKEDGLYKNRLDEIGGSYSMYDIVGGELTKVTDPAALAALNKNATTYMPFHENPVASTHGIEDGSFLRLNTVTLGYTLPKNILNKVGLERVRFYGSIYNAFTITGYSGLDPEVNTNTSQGSSAYPTPGLDWGSYPRARSFTFGVNVKF